MVNAAMSQISAHPLVWAQSKVRRPWALFRETTVYLCPDISLPGYIGHLTSTCLLGLNLMCTTFPSCPTRARWLSACQCSCTCTCILVRTHAGVGQKCNAHRKHESTLTSAKGVSSCDRLARGHVTRSVLQQNSN